MPILPSSEKSQSLSASFLTSYCLLAFSDAISFAKVVLDYHEGFYLILFSFYSINATHL